MTEIVTANWTGEWRRAWTIFASEYEGLERYQRDKIYQNARKNDIGHDEAMGMATSCPTEDLPEIMYVAAVEHE